MTPRWAEFRARRALARILGPHARIGRSVLLRSRTHTRIWRFDVEGGVATVLKWKEPNARVEYEARHLRAINAVVDVRSPRLLGCEGAYLAQEFRVGRPFGSLRAELPYAEYRAQVFAVVRTLVAIHAARDLVLAAAAPRERMTRRALESRLRRARAEIEAEVGRVRGDGFAPPDARRAALSPACLETLVADLHAERPEAVLGHGDFHAGNLLVGEDAELIVLDWGRLSLATPWCDLAHPLLALQVPDRVAAVDHYLAAAQTRGLLLGLEPAQAQRLARSGMAYTLLIAARRSLRSGREARGARRGRDLGARLDAVSALVG